MSILNASYSTTIGLDANASGYLSGNPTHGTADQTIIKTGSAFAELFDSGWRLDFFGTFSNYIAEDGEGPDGLLNTNVEYPASMLLTSLTASYQGNLVYEFTGLPTDAPQVDQNDEKNVWPLAGNDTIIGSQVADKLAGFAGNDEIDGELGIDQAIYRGNALAHTITKSGNGWIVSGGIDGTDTLECIERLQFSDKKIALDLETTGNAGQAMEFIGAVAPSLLNDVSIRGTIISLFDQGQTMQSLSQLALDLNLLPNTSSAALANAVYQNVVGGTAAPDMTDALVAYIDNNGQANFLATVAGLHLNVDLVGLQQTGVEYV